MMTLFIRMSLAIFLAGAFALPCPAEVPQWVKNKRHKILFLGDSNTFAGLYIGYVEGYLRTRFPEEPWELINLGLPSETVSGLSEPDHPYPRPDIHERVERALAKIKPNIVFICYGMNDGIYYPFSEDRLKKYKEGTEKLVAKAEKAGARVILMTPSPFDGLPMAKNLLPKDAPKFSWMKPYEKYDSEVLRKYSDYLLEWRKKDYVVVDAHAAVHRFLKAMRAKDPKYAVSGDGIHPNATGHAVIAFEILRELKAPAEVELAEIDYQKKKVLAGTATLLPLGKDHLVISFLGKFPMPINPGWHKNLELVGGNSERVNRHRVKITGLPEGKYDIVVSTGGEDEVLATATHSELAKGVSLRLRDAAGERNDRIGDLIERRHRLLGLAWLTDIGYKRPGTPKGLPLAAAQKQADILERELHKLVRPARFQVIVTRK